jgi:exoribonuclease-2
MPVHLLFDDDGAFKAGTILSATDASLQVELASGKRTKVKASHVLLRFDQPSPAQLLDRAQAAAQEIDLDFLWECAPQDEFGFEQLAREYQGRTPDAVEAAAILLRLHGAPVYFHRKGRGRYRPAPPEILKVALAAVERKREQEQLRQQYVARLKEGEVPEPIARQGVHLIVRPERNGIEYKAVEQAAAELQLTPLRLLLARGAIASPYRWHVDSFLALNFPRGTGFADELPPPQLPQDLPLAEVEAFSIDDSATTEIDDAFSVVHVADRVRVGIHIAAPAVVITREHALDAIARARMSTVYAPGLKFTMLPPPWIEAFSLNAGRTVPVLSLYIDVDPDSMALLATHTRVERLRIATNLRHDQLDEVVTAEAIACGRLAVACGAELRLLHRLALTLLRGREAVRGRPEPLGRVDYAFVVDGEGEAGHVTIRPRRRGAPLDLIVAELMILANSHWGGRLAADRIPAIYRSQSFERVGARPVGRVRMSTTPAPHEGIGVEHYAWSTSPLRRYVDLVNQRQLIAAARGETPPYAANDADLFAVVSGFDAAYAAYAEFQQRLERYWCLRWLRQENVRRIGATVIKGDVLRLDGLPMITRLPGLPELPRGQRLELDVLATDEVDLGLEARVHQVLAAVPDARVEEVLADDDEADFDPAPAAEPVLPPSG